MAPKSSYILTEAQKAKRMAEIKVLLKDMLKVIKVVSLYPADNPLPQSMRRNFAERLAQHIEDYGAVRIVVGRDTLTCDDETVYIDKSKEEALAALFFETGITSFVFMESFDIENAYKLLDIIKAYINSPDKSQDLANLLWESGISRFTYTTLEDIALAEYQGDFKVQELDAGQRPGGAGSSSLFGTDALETYGAIFSPSADGDSDSSEKRQSPQDGSNDSGKVSFRGGRRTPGATENHQFYALSTATGDNSLADVVGVEAVSFRTAEAAQAMGLDNLPSASPPRANTTLILNDELRLSEEDERAVSTLSARDADFDMWESSLELCKELLHQESELPDFSETVGICGKIGTEFLQAGKLLYAGQLVQYMTLLEEKALSARPLWAEKLQEARHTFGGHERMDILGETLNLHPDIGADELRRYLSVFDWHSLAAVTDLLGDLKHAVHREVVCDYLTGAGRKHLQILSRGVTDKRPQAVRGAIIVLSRIGDAQSLSILKKAATNDDRSVRLELVTQLKDYPGPEVLAILKIAVSDKDAEIRNAAINSIAAHRSPAAFEAVGEIIGEPSFVALNPEDRQRILVVYSILGGEDAVALLSVFIRRYNPFRNPIFASMRKAAIEALSHNESDRAERLLVRLANSWRPDIRSQAQEALKRRRDIIFGGINE